MPVQKPDSVFQLLDTPNSPVPSKSTFPNRRVLPSGRPFGSPFHKLAEVPDQLAGLLRSIGLDEQTQYRLGAGKAHQRPVVLAQVELRSIDVGDFDDRVRADMIQRRLDQAPRN